MPDLNLKVHHIGYLTKKLEKSRDQFLALGYTVEKPSKYDEIRDINIEFLMKDGYRVELIEPAGKESRMYPLLKTYRNTPYHICYEVKDIDAAVSELEEMRYQVIDPPETAPCIDGAPVAFLMHRSMGIIELVEIK